MDMSDEAVAWRAEFLDLQNKFNRMVTAKPISEAPKGVDILMMVIGPEGIPDWMASGQVQEDGRIWCDFIDGYIPSGEHSQTPTHFLPLTEMPLLSIPPEECHHKWVDMTTRAGNMRRLICVQCGAEEYHDL